MIWAPFLHWYQPPNQVEEIIKNIIRQSYDPVISLIERYSEAKITLNINGCTTEQLAHIEPGILERIKNLVDKGQIELVGSAKYHPLLPLISKHEMIRQIELNMQTNQIYFGDSYAPKGFFPPELAFSDQVASVISEMGFKWILLDEISFNGSLSIDAYDKVYFHKKYPALKLFFSDRQLSDILRSASNLSSQEFLYNAKAEITKHKYFITANDGEVFGHHYKSREDILEFAFSDPEIETLTLSEIISKFDRHTDSILPKPASWDTSVKDLKERIFYPLWNNPNNKIHKLQWELTDLAINSFDKAKRPENDIGLVFVSSRDHLDRGLHSCHYWWASANPWWNPDMITYGATELIQSMRGLSSLSKETKRKAEKIYATIIETAWKWHWGGEAQKRMDEYDRKFRK